MLAKIQEQFERLNQKRQSLLQRLELQSPKALSFKAGPDKWSVVEAIEHLVVVEDNFLDQVTANITASSLDPTNRSPEKYQIVLKVMNRDIKVDVPHESMEPRGHFDFNELVARWEDIREKMKDLLESIDTDNPQNMVYQHPYAGPLNIAETLEFMEVHFDNHARHIDVILARVKD